MLGIRSLSIFIRQSALQTLLGLIFAASGLRVAQAQGTLEYTNDFTLTYALTDFDILVNAPDRFPNTLTLSAGAIVSSNNLDDGHHSVEVFNRNSISVNGGQIISQDGRLGGVTAHDSSGVTIASGSMDYVICKDATGVGMDGGTVRFVTLEDASNSTISGGSLSSVMAYGSSRCLFFGGAIGPEGLFSFDNSILLFEGTSLKLYNPTPAIAQGRQGFSYKLRGRLENGYDLNTTFFRESDAADDPVSGIRFNHELVTALILPESGSGALLCVGLTMFAALRVRAKGGEWAC